MSDDQIEDTFLTEAQLAKRWGIRLELIQKWRHYGTGPRFIKIGHAVRYPPQYIKEYEEEQTRTGTTKRKVA